MQNDSKELATDGFGATRLGSYKDLLRLANISECSVYCGVYMQEIQRLVVRGLELNFRNKDLWEETHQHTKKFLSEFPEIVSPVRRGTQSNPVCGGIRTREFLACILQPAESHWVDKFDSLKLLLLQLVIKSSPSQSSLAEISNEIRKSRELSSQYRLSIMGKLPDLGDKDYFEKFYGVIETASVKQLINPGQKRYLDALSRLVDIKNNNRRLKSRSKPSDSIMMDKIILSSKKIKRRLGITGVADVIEKDPIGLYEIIEPPDTDLESLGEHPESSLVFEKMVDPHAFAYDVEPLQKRRKSAYWLEQETLVSQFNTGLLVRPERERLCNVLRGYLKSDNDLYVFCAGLIAVSYTTSIGISELLRDCRGSSFSDKGQYLRKVHQPESCYIPTNICDGEWVSPAKVIELGLPDELSHWLSVYVSEEGGISSSKFKSEVVSKNCCREIMEHARNTGKYNLTEGSIRVAMKRNLSRTYLGSLATWILTGSEHDRPPVNAYYACVSTIALQDCYGEVLSRLWV